MHHGEYRHPRLVEVYDAECPWGPDDDCFMGLVADAAAAPADVLDLGCGTGRLALGLAAAGHRITGVDPAAASLAAARRKPGAERVTWIEGTSAAIPADAAFDVAVMTSHVSGLITDDAELRATLADLRRALRPGATLVFDSYDPAARRWERWNPVDSPHRVTLTDGTIVDVWIEVTSVVDGVVTFVHHYAFSDGTAEGTDDLTSEAAIRFRPEADVRAAVADTGFAVAAVYGGWQRQPVGAPDGDGELIVVATAV